MERLAFAKRGRRLEYFTIAWNSLEGLLSVAAGLLAGSIALVGFGLDSFIEVTSGAALIWRLGHEGDSERRERSERIVLRIVGVLFLALAAYVIADAIFTLVRGKALDRSILGIVIAVLSLFVMPLLARAKRKLAVGLDSGAMRADSRQTDICAYLSAILLGGLILNATLGWWWADPVAALAMSPIIAKEGVEAFQQKSCC